MTASPFRLYALIAASALRARHRAPGLRRRQPEPDGGQAEGGNRGAEGHTKADKKKKAPKKEEKKSEQQFIDGYKSAHAMIYKRHDYAAGIDKLQIARPRRQRGRRQPDRLFQPQARPLRGLQGLV